MFGLTAILTILLHLAPNLGGMAWSIYQNKGVHLVALQSSKGSAMKPKIVIHNHYQKPARDAVMPAATLSDGELKRTLEELRRGLHGQGPSVTSRMNELLSELKKRQMR